MCLQFPPTTPPKCHLHLAYSYRKTADLIFIYTDLSFIFEFLFFFFWLSKAVGIEIYALRLGRSERSVCFCGGNKFRRHIRTFTRKIAARYLALLGCFMCGLIFMRAPGFGESGHLDCNGDLWLFFFLFYRGLGK